MRRAVVFGLLHAGLAVSRSLGRAGIPVTGIARDSHEFGLRSRYLEHRLVVPPQNDDAVLEVLQGERAVFFPERDEHVEFVLRHWEDVHALADTPLPNDAEAVRRLRRKDLLPLAAAEADVPTPGTVLADSDDAVRDAGLRPPLVVKAAEGQEYSLVFGQKAVLARDVDEALTAAGQARELGFQMIVQEVVPDSHERVYSLLTYIGRSGEPLVTLVGRKVRQGPLRFGTSAVFASAHDPEVHELGHRLLRAAGYTGLAHVELVRDPRDGGLKLLEVNTRPPIWAGIAMGPELGMARIAYDDLTGAEPRPERTLPDGITWLYLAKDVWVSAQMARRRELHPREFLRHYVGGKKVRAVFAADDPRPALASLGYLRSRV